MVFNFENQAALEDICFHDSVFEGFVCDYGQRQVRFSMRHEWNGKVRHLQDPRKDSLLDEGIRFISVMMQIISGDELRITCESVEVTEEEIAQ